MWGTSPTGAGRADSPDKRGRQHRVAPVGAGVSLGFPGVSLGFPGAPGGRRDRPAAAERQEWVSRCRPRPAPQEFPFCTLPAAGPADGLQLSASPELPRPKQAASPQFRSASKPGGHGSMESQPLALTVDISKGAIPAPEPPTRSTAASVAACSLPRPASLRLSQVFSPACKSPPWSLSPGEPD